MKKQNSKIIETILPKNENNSKTCFKNGYGHIKLTVKYLKIMYCLKVDYILMRLCQCCWLLLLCY